MGHRHQAHRASARGHSQSRAPTGRRRRLTRGLGCSVVVLLGDLGGTTGDFDFVVEEGRWGMIMVFELSFFPSFSLIISATLSFPRREEQIRKASSRIRG